MKRFSLLFAILFSQFLRAQTCDSVIVIYHTNHDQQMPVTLAGVETDTIIINGSVKSTTYSYGLQTIEEYDSLQRLVAIKKTWYATNYDSIAFEYDSLSNLISKTNYKRVLSNWQYSFDTTRVEYHYTGIRLDSVIHYVWNGIMLVPIHKSISIYTLSDTLSEIRAEKFDTISGQWYRDTLTVVNYTGPPLNQRIDSVFSLGVYPSQCDGFRIYDSLDRVIRIEDFFFGTPDVYKSFSYECGQLQGYGSSAWGSHSGYVYEVEFDSLCRIRRVIAGHYHVNGGNTIDHFDYYYTDCSTLVALATVDTYLCSGDSLDISVMHFGGTGPFHIQWSPANSLSNDTAIVTKAFPDTTTDYLVSVTDSNGLVATDIVRINVAARPEANIYISSIDTLSACPSAVLHTDTISTVIFSWRKAGSLVTLGMGTNLLITENGTYIVSAQEDRYGWMWSCPIAIDSFDFQLFSNQLLDVTVSVQCDHIVADAPDALQFEWYRSGQLFPGSISNTFYPTQTGYYTAIAIDSNGCSSPMSMSAYYKVPTSPLSLNPNIVHPSCDTCSDGVIYPNAAGGATPYLYIINGTPIAQTYQDSCSGGYYVICVKDNNNCTVCDSNALVHVDDRSPLMPISVYPNPFDEELNFHFPENVDIHDARLTVYDMTGRIVGDILIPGNRFIYKQESLGRGVYYFVILNKDGILSRGRIVRQ